MMIRRERKIDLRHLLGFAPADDELTENDEWRRGPRVMAESAVLSVRYAPSRLCWTDEPPSSPGLYFVRAGVDGPARVVEVYWAGRQLVGEWSDIPSFAVRASGYQFSDHPVREPR